MRTIPGGIGLIWRSEIRRLQEKPKFAEHFFFFSKENETHISIVVYITYGYLKLKWQPVRIIQAVNTLSLPPPKMGGCYHGCLPLLRFPVKSRVTATCQRRWLFIAGGFLATTLKSLAALGGGGGGIGMGGSFHHCVSRLRDRTQREAMMGEEEAWVIESDTLTHHG